GRRARRVEVLADVQVVGLEPGLTSRALEARPPEVLDDTIGRRRDAVDLLPVEPADVPYPDLLRPGANREAERVAEPVGDDAPSVRIMVPTKGIAGVRLAGERIDAEDGPIQPGRVRTRPKILRAQGASLGRGRIHLATDPARRISARVDGIPVLAVVHE